MNNNVEVHPSNGSGFCGMLTILFIALKLLKVINWSWIWVFSPLWVPIVLFMVLIIAYYLGR